MTDRFKRENGFGLVEIIVGSALISATLFALLGVAANAVRLSRETARLTQASFLVEEGIEAVKTIRDRGWTQNIMPLTTGSTYYISFATTTWQTTTTPEIVNDIFHRSFTLDAVDRSSSDDIASSGTNDPNTRKVSVTVWWIGGRQTTTTEEAATYITNFFND